MSKIALVAVAMMVAGERKVFQPGEKLPELNAHDEAALLASKSIKDPDQEARAEDIAGLRAELVAREFQDERQRVQAERASAQAADPTGEGSGGTSGIGETQPTAEQLQTSTSSGSATGADAGTSGATQLTGALGQASATNGADNGEGSTAAEAKPSTDSASSDKPTDAAAPSPEPTKPAAKTSGKSRS